MAEWIPNAASVETEELMEAKDLPESDRDEVRRFAEFLQRRKDKRAGKDLPPAPAGMLGWLKGESSGEKG